ncbi:MAG: carbamate kinase family protein [Burkholderiaceae bacterium]|uniref:Carbamate kinase n=1 Tax=Herminiimonas contaminans TaxID=1111140 RepID=A0ABS0EPQ9_9BURK|nr:MULTISPECIES: carbamate kinase family protein [Oxalobacteraceae]MBF8176844.1 carbamate kinase family protein [Herminiimonas contaminans]MBX9800145.1 carbamate kinase family protein [Burkholderiaceae bacterium]
MNELVVIAIGGNSIITSNEQQSIQHQEKAIQAIVSNIADMLEGGYNIVLTHGNGPQVGLDLRRAEVASQYEDIPIVPLANCVANTQGGIGYQLQQGLVNELTQRGINKQVITLITRVEVAADDINFSNPTKPIGAFFSEQQRDVLMQEHPDWKFVEDSGRGYRRVVASPVPVKVLETDAITSLLDRGFVVIALGGGGIPVVQDGDHLYRGVDAVIDKDLATTLLAKELNADILAITTGVEKVCINFGKPNQQALGQITTDETRRYMSEGHFPAGSMLPKIEASLNFLAAGGNRVIITTPEKLPQAIKRETGTHIVTV